MTIKNYDVIIVGAGPAGTSCALHLKDAGLNIALIDRSIFPRNKTCGDAIPEPALKILKQFLAEDEHDLGELKQKAEINTCTVYTPRWKKISVEWFYKSYNSPRYYFDNFLLNLAKKNTKFDLYEGVKITDIKNDANVKLFTKDGLTFTSQMVIGCDGAHSVIAKKLGSQKVNPSHYSMAVSAYYKNLDCPQNMACFFFLQEYIPGYFWIFPVGNNEYNVGFGMLAKKIIRSKINLKKTFEKIISNKPEINKFFKKAEIKSVPQGFGLPLGGKKRKNSGKNYILTGDAASLVDPLQGSGIDKAMVSGKLAAEQVISCFMQGDFSDNIMRQYDEKIYQVIGKELKRNHLIMRLLFMRPWTINFLAGFFRIEYFKRRFLRMF